MPADARRQGGGERGRTGAGDSASWPPSGGAVLVIAVGAYAAIAGIGGSKQPSKPDPTGPGAGAPGTAKGRAIAPAPKPQEVTAECTVLNGQWRIDDKGELVQERADDPARIYFGDPEWTDYDIEFQAKWLDGPHGFGVTVRSADVNSGYVLVFGMNGQHKTQELWRWKPGGQRDVLNSRDYGVLRDRWYKVKVEVRDQRLRCSLDGTNLVESDDPGYPRGMVGLFAWSQCRFKDVRVTVRRPKLPNLVVNALALPKDLRPPASTADFWTIEGDELVQTSHLTEMRLVFGDKTWTDYDFTFEAMKLTGTEGFGAIVRALDVDNWLSPHFGGWVNNFHAFQGRGRWQGFQRTEPGHIRAGKWYTVRTEVRGKSARVFLDGEEKLKGTEIESTAGAVGLRTYRTTARFRNFKVTAPDGTVLFEGLPDLAKAERWRMVVPISLDHETLWKYTFEEPAADWTKPDFNDSDWKNGKGGFACYSTAGTTARTEWWKDDIWLRREIDLPPGPVPPLQLLLQHDDEAEVYLNGVRAGQRTGATDYQLVPIEPAARATLKPGKNLIAVHCHNSGGYQCVDVGLVEVRGP